MYETSLILSAILFGLICLFYINTGLASIFHPVTYYLAFHGIVFVLRPFFQYYGDYQSIYEVYKFVPTDAVKLTTLLIANIGLICFVASALYVGRRPMRFAPEATLAYQATERRGGKQLLLTLAICSPLIALSFHYALQATPYEDSPLASMIRDQTTNYTIFTSNTGYILAADTMMLSLSVLIAWAFRFRLISLIPLAGFVAIETYIGFGRWAFVMTLASFGLLYLYDKRRRWVTLRFVVLAALVLVVFSALGTSRTAIHDWVTGQQTEGAEGAFDDPDRKGYFDQMDFANLEFLEYIVSIVPDKTRTYDYFLKNLELFTAPVPRILWPGKPIGPPIQLYNINDYGYPIGITWTLVGEGWQDCGYLGVIIWCCFGGALWGLLYRWFVNSKQTRTQIAVYCVLLPISIQWFRDGILITLVKFPFFPLLAILIWHAICQIGPLGRKLITGQVALHRRASHAGRPARPLIEG
ncbi:MAG: hypothetical protein WCB34_03840 [Methylovirgula sp.]